MAIEWYQVQVEGIYAGQQMMNTFRFKGDGVTTNDTLLMSEQLIDDFFNIIWPLLADLLPDQYFLLRILAKRFAPVGSAVAKRIFDVGTQAGTVNEAAAPGQVCPAVRLVPAMGGVVVGRIFLPTIPETLIFNNGFTAGYIANVDTLMNQLTTAFGGGVPQWNLVIAQGTTPGAPVEVAGWNLSPRIGFQKRRVIPL